MARDPWKRAYDRKRLEGGGGDPRKDHQRLRRSSPAMPGLLVVLLLVLAGTAFIAWYYRSSWLPQVRQELPPAVAEHVPVPHVEVDYSALEHGVGHGLVLLGDYLDLISGTREMEPAWQVTQTGPQNLRLESDGIKVYVKDGLIQTYTLDVPQIFISEKWKAWRKEWKEAGIFPELTWQEFSGEEQQPRGETEHLYVSDEAVRLPAGWMHRAFNLVFEGGVLRRIEGRLEFGPSAGPGDG